MAREAHNLTDQVQLLAPQKISPTFCWDFFIGTIPLVFWLGSSTVEQRLHKATVVGSNPTPATGIIRGQFDWVWYTVFQFNTCVERVDWDPLLVLLHCAGDATCLKARCVARRRNRKQTATSVVLTELVEKKVFLHESHICGVFCKTSI